MANGVVYASGVDDKLYAYDANGTTNCSGTPKTCSPLWTATLGTTTSDSSPAVVGGVVYVGSNDSKLYAFDANGNTNCSGVPKTCSPLWTAATPNPFNFSSPAVANGVVYAGSSDLEAFDANGTTQLLGNAEDLQPHLGRERRSDGLVAERGEWSGLHRLIQQLWWPAVWRRGLRRDRNDRLRRDPQAVHPAVDRRDWITRSLVPGH